MALSQCLLADDALVERYAMAGSRRAHHDSALLVRKTLAPAFVVAPLAQNSARTVVLATFRNCAVASLHLQSDFFTEAATAIKAAQLRDVGRLLDESGAAFAFALGDANLTGGPHLLPLENAAIADAGFRDLYAELHLLTDEQRAESQMKKEWKETHCTWDGSHNPLVKHRHEHHRPDRVLAHGAAVRAERVVRVRGRETPDELGQAKFVPLSDHYGLMGCVSVCLSISVCPLLRSHSLRFSPLPRRSVTIRPPPPPPAPAASHV